MTRLPILLCLVLVGCGVAESHDSRSSVVFCTDHTGTEVARSSPSDDRWEPPHCCYGGTGFKSSRGVFAAPPGSTCDVREVRQ